MTSELDAATFDIADMFSGISYPTEVVTVYTNPGVAYKIHKLQESAMEAVREQDEAKAQEVQEKLEGLLRKGANSRYEIHLRGHSREDRISILDVVRSEFPVEVDFLGREKPNPAADEKFANLIWALYIEKIVSPSGAVKGAPSPEEVRILRGQLEDSEVNKVEKGIAGLSEGAKGGFESLAQEHDFLSSASPEA